MKKFTAILVLFMSFAAQAGDNIKIVASSSKDDAQVNVARVVKVVNLVDKPGIMVNVSVEDTGGSTDVSPTQRLYLTLYSKGEMFSTDATFNLGRVYSLTSAKRLEGGVYEIVVLGTVRYDDMPKKTTLIVDARKAVVAIKNVQCEGFDCAASENFKSEVYVEARQ